jgi:four helix bundle protein
MSRGYKDLHVWIKSFEMTLKIYQMTKKYPDEELYGLVSQMRRASVSITANIVEGHGKQYPKEFKKFISNAIGSCNELGVYLLLSKCLEYLNSTEYNELKLNHDEVSKMLFGLRRSLETKIAKINNKDL